MYRQLANYLEVKPNDCHIGKFTEQQCESAVNYPATSVHSDHWASTA
ncbi:hypothetical protein BIZ38_21070 [Pseudoalteromonas sp. BZK2]|nr:hypothetical protein [Pseudoalteromonas sp. BZK2]MBC7010938.1 hypothetical protein [Pseudoalteromonas sp. BZK2]